MINDFINAGKSKVTNFLVNRRLIQTLTDKIDPNGTRIGEPHYNTYYKNIKQLVNSGDVKGALNYSKQEAAKVQTQIQAQSKPRLDQLNAIQNNIKVAPNQSPQTPTQ